MGYLGNQITTVFPTSISVDSATISGNASVGGTLGVTGVSTLSDNIVFDASSKGVHLGVTSATASNLLDDYEEGTFEVTFSPSSGSVTAPSGSNLLKYLKIGTAVFISGGVNNVPISSPSGSLTMSSLPFANGTGTDNSGRTAGLISFGGTSSTGDGQSGGKFMAWGFIGESATTVAIQVDSSKFINNSTDMYFNFFYRTDS